MTTAQAAPTVHRFTVRVRQDLRDPAADRLLSDAKALGYSPSAARTAKIYLIEADLSPEQLRAVETELLVDPVIDTGEEPEASADAVVEVHPLPGVTDPAALSVADAIESLTGLRTSVQTGRRYEITGVDQPTAEAIAAKLLANPVVHRIHAGTFHPGTLPAGTASEFSLTHVPIRELDDQGLMELSKRGHLFLDLAEMKAIQAEYQTLGREPTDIELETLAQTWSEHCVHKTLKSTVRYTTDQRRGREHAGPGPIDNIDWSNRPGVEINDDGSITINNLLKSTVAAATFELIEEGLDWTLSVFVDNAGIIRFDDDHAVCVKVETHNRPSAIEPYGGAATGIGGCIRDIIGTGLAAKPIASTDVFCVGTPTIERVPEGCIHPTRILDQVVAGVRDYGNRMGIPTVNGAVWFDDRYVGNPLVYCGCIGVMPADKIEGDAKPGDLIVALGGRTGRDGIHGATFSSGEVTSTHADEFSHAVQIGNPIEEKRVLDAILRARDHQAGCLFTAITDCGAGGFSSAVGEMGEKVGATVHLDRAPLKYEGLTYTEIWISEAQERMVLAVDPEHLEALRSICDEEHVELAVLGEFGARTNDDQPELVLNYAGTKVGRMPMPFLHEGIPTPTREAIWTSSPVADGGGGYAEGVVGGGQPTTREALLKLLAHPNIASKHAIIRQYDHEVQGNTLLKPLVGPGGRGPGDAAVIEPVPGSGKGLAIANGLATNIGDPKLGGDPYQMGLAAIDECVRNLVCVGANPDRIAILDNFCWPSCAKPENLASLVRAAVGCYDGAKAYKTPFISGKDSLNNQFTTKDGELIEIPPTLLISGVGIVDDVSKCVTMDAKRAGNKLVFIEAVRKDAEDWSSRWDQSTRKFAACHYSTLFGIPVGYVDAVAEIDLEATASVARAVATGIRDGLVASAHDVSDGGAITAVAEMLIAADGGLGANIMCDMLGASREAYYFGERPGGYILEVPSSAVLHEICSRSPFATGNVIGEITEAGRLALFGVDESIPVDDLTNAWLGTLDD
ncbi:MAG: phosphoribosylformylglycinamidine synthase subunit PurS [Planctomycetota bacterium]